MFFFYDFLKCFLCFMKQYVFFWFLIFFMIFYFFVFYEKTCFFFYEKYIWLYLWFWKNGFCVLWNMTISMFFYLIYFVFSWLWWFLCLFLFYDVAFDFLFFCFSFLNNWLENIERTITLHVFLFQTHGEQQTNNNVFLFHTHGEHWTNIDFAFIYLFKFILALALGLVVFWPLVSEKRIEQQILQISQTAPTAAWWQAVRCQWWLTNKKTNYVVCVCVGGAGRCQCWG